MKITYMAWKQVIFSDVKRLIYGIQGKGPHDKGDQAIGNFCTSNQNPGLWGGFTANAPIETKDDGGTTIPIENSANDLVLWCSSNDKRNDPIKISQQIWDNKKEHAYYIIEPWYLGYMRILRRLLRDIIGANKANQDTQKLLNYVDSRLNITIDKSNVLDWIHATQDGFCAMTLNTTFMEYGNIKELLSFITDSYYLVVKCNDGKRTFNLALMADSKAPDLHPEIKELLCKQKVGGQAVNIDVSYGTPSKEVQGYLSALYSHKNIILYGPPGTGKTHLLTEMENHFNNTVTYNDLDTEAPFKVGINFSRSEKAWCTFHPSYSYETFVCGLTPVITSSDRLGFKPHIGPMLRLAKAAESGTRSLLIIDEINRANTDAVFGNASAVIDPYMKDTVTLPTPVKDDNGNTISDFSSSDNLYIIGTMNSLDKSTSPLSAVLKRKFLIIELAPNVDTLRSHLAKNTTVSTDLADLICRIMEEINDKIHRFCGKEYELGQGYFWGLVEAQQDHEDILAEILRNKIVPHLRDILQTEYIGDFFGQANIGALYTENSFGYEIADCNLLTNEEIINAFAAVVGSSYRYSNTSSNTSIPQTIDQYNDKIIGMITHHLDLYKNVILSGCSGCGKTFYASKLFNSGIYTDKAKSHWHGSTEYADVIEGISAVVDENDNITYSIQKGAVRKLAESALSGSKQLMVIESIDKSNAAENFGELITLLEPDKRALKIMVIPLTHHR